MVLETKLVPPVNISLLGFLKTIIHLLTIYVVHIINSNLLIVNSFPS